MSFRNSDFLVVATVSHVSQALVTINSAKRYAPDAGYHLFILDATMDAIERIPLLIGPSASGVSVFGPNDLGQEQDLFLSAFKYYNAVELSCLSKYVAVAHVLRKSSNETCVYADADILVLDDFREALHEIDDSVVLATPHQTGCTTDDREHECLLYGWLNAGFFCVQNTNRTQKVLDWLINRISRRGYYAPQYGMSADQRWFSSLPLVFPELTKVSQNPGLNVGYWNIHQRVISRAAGRFLANGRPLIAFHFSGLDPARPSLLSTYSDIEVPRGSPIADLCKIYINDLNEMAPLRVKLAGLKKLPCSSANLDERMMKGSIQNELSLVNPSRKVGLFSRVGRRADLALGRIMARVRH